MRNRNVQASLTMPLIAKATLLIGFSLLAACATQGPAVVPVDQQNLQRATDLAEAGETDAALALLSELSTGSTGAALAAYSLAAARLQLERGDTTGARRSVAQARDAGAVGYDQTIIVLAATIELEENRPLAALELLDQLTTPPEPAILVESAAVRGRALFDLMRVEEAVATFVEREVWLEDSAAVAENHELIWSGLLEQIESRPVVTSGDPTIDGWLALLPVAAAYRSDPAGLERGLASWSETFPRHPATETFLATLIDRYRLSQIYPEQVALLLPLGSLGEQAAAIRDGFIAAHLRTGVNGERTHIKVYDTDALGSDEAYRRAELEGANFIVGPLLKPNVDRIVTNVGFTPTLALNFAQDDLVVPENFFQFALAPEDEALEVARHAIASGARTAVALVPNSDWGRRLLFSFQGEFERLEGRLLEYSYYNPNSQDFSLPITTLMNLAQSTQRYRRLAANLGVPLEFEPRRRQDVDVIFLATNADNGRLLAPQLRFHYAGDLPTYATPEIYAPAGMSSDVDLDGILFPDAPWLLSPDAAAMELKSTLASYWPQRVAQWPRLFAMGFDAYRLIPLLYGPSPGFSAFPAMSGELSLDERGRVHRSLPLAQFRDGRPTMLGVGPRNEVREVAAAR